MAVKWAVANGNWSAGATWNGGVAPTSADDVYANGHVITCNVAINVKSLTNAVCPNTNIGGGHFTRAIASNEMIRGNLIQYGGEALLILTTAAGRVHYVVGNIVSDNNYAIQVTSASWGYTLNITGNITTGNKVAIYSRSSSGDSVIDKLSVIGNAEGRSAIVDVPMIPSFDIVGDCLCAPIGSGQVISTLIVNGNLSYASSFRASSANISNTITADYSVMNGTTLTLGGSIIYKSTNNAVGVLYANLNILNPDSFAWKDVTQPQRVNPFVIVTDFELNNRQQYPAENDVKKDVEYAFGNLVGTLDPVTANVGCVTKEDVREGVELIGLQEVGTLVVPSVDDVREGVVFDNGSVGTLIVQGGGDRLRIADFGYYTNAQSDTYIVDLTEQDKPKFAVAEERVLIEMFPDLDLDNIPEKYFDDLFVKYLKYRLIVEYYRTAGINSTFTPSEPTTEIVNYQNVRNEVWLNSANIYLKAWSKKYPESIVKPQRILL